MLSKSPKPPSSAYVLVVMSLAAFLVLFSVSRRPNTQYVTQVRIPLQSSTESTGKQLADLRAYLLNADNVLVSLRDAGMVPGDATANALDIASEIAGRMLVVASPTRDPQSDVHPSYAQLSLLTKHPEFGVKLLDQMVENIPSPDVADELSAISPAATAERIRGSAIASSSLLLIIMCSTLVGLGGIVWLEHTNVPPVLVTEEDVVTTARLPVIVDFTRHKVFPTRDKRRARRRRFRVALRVAEGAIAAAVVLMLFNLATVQTFSDLLTQDPLAAYSEALGRILS